MSATSRSDVAFLFPGQGSQRVGMLAALEATDPGLVERHLGLAEELSGLPLRRLCAGGPPEQLKRTEVSQPALLALSLALIELAREAGLRPAFVAGHSLGEYAAAVAAGALGAEDAMRLVVRRSRLMAALQAERPGAMAAVLGPPAETVAGWCEAASTDCGPVAVANLNAPTQTVVSGAQEGVDGVCALAGEAGARAVHLPVGGAFHSPQMEPVRDALAGAAAAIEWRPAAAPLAANARGALVSSAAGVRAALVAQVAAPVRWVECMRALRAAGCTRFLELGPGRVLGGLARAIVPDAEVAAAGSRAALSAFAA
jgi:[acyl-carrier-protein] S-malonyltransferase